MLFLYNSLPANEDVKYFAIVNAERSAFEPRTNIGASVAVTRTPDVYIYKIQVTIMK